MKKVMKFLRILFVVLIVCTVGITTQKVCAAKQIFDINIEYGFDKEARYGRHIPVKFFITNVKEDFDGKIQLYIGGRNPYMIEKDFVISKGEEKNIIVPVRANNVDCKIEYDIINKKGKVVDSGRKTIKSKLVQNAIYVGAITDDYQALAYMNDINITSKELEQDFKVKLFKVEKEDIVEDYHGFDMFDIIVINNYNIENLSEMQISAIEEWVKNGGKFIIGTGENGKKSYSKFNDIANTFNIDGLSSKTWTTSDSQKFTVDSYTVASSNGEATLKSDSGEELAVNNKVNEGKCTIVGFDLGLKSYSDLINNDASSIKKIIETVLGQETFENILNAEMIMNNFNSYSFKDNVCSYDKKEKPNLIVLTIIIVVYILVCIPIIFIVLKKTDRTKYSYTGLMMLSFVVSLMIYIIGYSSRMSRPYITYLNSIEKKGNNITENVIVDAMSADNDTYKFDIDGNYNVEIYDDEYYWYDEEIKNNPRDYKTSMKTIGNKTQLTIRNAASFEDRFLMLNKKSSLEDFPSIDYEITIFDGEATGQVVNASDKRLEDVCVVFGDKYVYLGDIEPGNTLSISESEKVWYNYGTLGTSKHKDEKIRKTRNNYFEFLFESYEYNGIFNEQNKIYFFLEEDKDIVDSSKCDESGMTVYSTDIDVSYVKDGQRYCENVPYNFDYEFNQHLDWYEHAGRTEVYFYGNTDNKFRVDYDLSNYNFSSLCFNDNVDEIYDYKAKFEGKISVVGKDNKTVEISEPFSDINMSELAQYINADKVDGQQILTFEFEYTADTTKIDTVLVPQLTGKEEIQ